MIEALEAPTVQTWKTVKLGARKTSGEYHQALRSAEYFVGDWVTDILDKARFTCATEETDVNLVILSIAELGFEDGAKYSEICAHALELGLKLCPAEVGPALRLTYRDQPRGECLVIAMNTVSVTGSDLNLFSVEHVIDGLWLYGYYGHPDFFWASDSRFVFVSR